MVTKVRKQGENGRSGSSSNGSPVIRKGKQGGPAGRSSASSSRRVQSGNYSGVDIRKNKSPRRGGAGPNPNPKTSRGPDLFRPSKPAPRRGGAGPNPNPKPKAYGGPKPKPAPRRGGAGPNPNPKAKTEFKSFGEAFKHHRKKGDKTFTYKGKSYSTVTKDDIAKAFKAGKIKKKTLRAYLNAGLG